LKRKFITNLALLLILNLMVKPFWMFGIDRTVQNTVGAEEYGLYFSLFSFSILINIFLDLGITNFNNRSVARNPAIVSEYFSKIVPLKFVLSIVYALIVILAGIVIGYSQEQFNLLYVLIFNNFLLSFILYLRSNISGMHFFKTDSLLSVLDRLLMIVICSVLLWGHVSDKPFKISWFVYAQSISYLLTLIIALGVVLYKSGRIKLNFNLHYGFKILKQSYPYALLILLMSFFNRIDSVMMERMLVDGKEQAGIYAQAFRILDAVVMFAFLFAGLLLPMFSRMIKNNDAIGPLLKLSFSLLIIPALTLVIVSMFYGEELMTLLYHEHVDISSRIFTRLIFAFIFISTTYIFGTLLTANGSLKQLNILAGLTVLLNIGLNLLLIPKFKAEGAAYASVTSQAFYAICQVFIARRIFRLKTDYSTILKMVTFSACLIISGIILHNAAVSWLIGFFTLSSLGILYSWILKILTPKEVLEILRAN
jgi:O-antigen/teichoic acid export membrane protein